MLKIKAYINRHPVLAYYILVFAISWGGILIALGPGGFLGTSVTARTQLFVGGPISLLGPSISGVLLTGLIYGKPGLRQLLSRLLKWRVGAGWYALVLLTAPVLTTASLLALSITPAIMTAEDKVGMLLSGIALGFISSPFFEELGWIGFATPELRKRFSVLETGLIMGLLWGVWHFPIFSASARASTSVPPALFLAILLFTWLLPYRVLIVWVYDHTKSLLLSILMHVPIVVGQFVLWPSDSTSGQIVFGTLVFTATLWVLVMVVFAVSRGSLKARSNTDKLPI
jgi:membrane protease YdiL (CAAX protease family)